MAVFTANSSAVLVAGLGDWLPLADAEIGWVIPTVIAAAAGWFVDRAGAVKEPSPAH